MNQIKNELYLSRAWFCYYSQHAATFLLTLLPNVRELELPRAWRPTENTNRLIAANARKAQQPSLPYHRRSLARTSMLNGSSNKTIEWTGALFTLPEVRYLGVLGSVSSDRQKLRPQGVGNSLRIARLHDRDIDPTGIADFLKCTPHLTTLTYSQLTFGRYTWPYHELSARPEVMMRSNWDLCNFVKAIGQEAGSHLVELSIPIRKVHGFISSGQASLHESQRLR